MISRTRWVSAAAVVVFSIGMLGSLTGCFSRVAEADPDASRPVGEVIFEFGQEDRRSSEFTGSQFITEYRCRVGVDCSTEAISYRHGRVGSGALERIIISFRLDQAYSDIILRLARKGSETTVVNVDRRKTYLVTDAVLGSAETDPANPGSKELVGAYNLKLGALRKGRHRIELTVADDGKGNGFYRWDAFSLIAKTH